MPIAKPANATLAAALILAAAALPASAQDFEMPTRKPGLWEMKMVTGQPGMPEMVTQFCTDAESDKAMMQAGMAAGKDRCGEPEMSRDGDTITIISACPTGPMTLTITGDFESAYTMRMSLGGVPSGMQQEARWVSDSCPGGMVPGDMTMPGGMKMNIHDIMKTGGGG